jgi:hypothetical protein
MPVDRFVVLRKTDGGDLDIKALMKTPVGRWAIVPALVGILAIFAGGLILTLINLQSGLPQWVYGAPGLPAVVLYYAIQLRKLWHHDIKPDLTIAKDSNVTKQTVKGGSVAPTFQGDGNTINNTFIQHAPTKLQQTSAPPTIIIQPHVILPSPSQEPRTPAVLPMPNRAVPEPVKVELKEKPVASKPEPEVIHDGPLKVKKADRAMIEFVAEKGDVLKGTVLSSAPLFAWIWTEEAVAKYHGTKNIGASLICNNTPGGVIDV